MKLQKPELEKLLEKGEVTIQPLKENGEGYKDESVTIELTEDVEAEQDAWTVTEG